MWLCRLLKKLTKMLDNIRDIRYDQGKIEKSANYPPVYYRVRERRTSNRRKLQA